MTPASPHDATAQPTSTAGSRRCLVAGLGNVFQGDDGFGVHVAQQLAARPVPEGVTVKDIGIRGVHLAYELLDGWDRVLLVDAAPHGQAPGTVSVLDPGDIRPPAESMLMDAHDMRPEGVLALVAQMGGHLDDVRIIACEPADLTPGMDLSPPVADAVDAAVDALLDLLTAEPDASAHPATPT